MTTTFLRNLGRLLVPLLSFATGVLAQTNTFPASGNVGIGTATPGDLLTVSAGNVVLDTGNNNSFIARYSAGSNLYSGSFLWDGLQLGNNGANYIVAGRSVAGGQLNFVVNNTRDFPAIDGKIALTIASNGNVGIGTQSPSDKLNVVAGINRALQFGIAGGYGSPADFSSGGVYLGLSRPYDGAITSGLFSYDTSNGASNNLALTSRSDIVFLGGGGAFGQSPERVRITATGQMGIGTSNPAAALDVVGTIRSTGLTAGSIDTSGVMSTDSLTSHSNGPITIAKQVTLVGGAMAVAPFTAISSVPAGSFIGQFVGTAASNAAQDILLAGKSGVSNGLTVQYSGTAMVYQMSGGNLNVGGNITGNALTSSSGGIAALAPNGSEADLYINQVGLAQWSLRNLAGSGDFLASVSGNDWLKITRSSGVVQITSGTPSNSSNTGALIVSGGVGIQGALNAGSANFSGAITAGSFTSGGSGSLNLRAGGANSNVTISPSGNGSTVVSGLLQATNGLAVSPSAAGPALNVAGQIGGSQSVLLTTANASNWVGPGYNFSTPGIFVQNDASHSRLALLAGGGFHPVAEGVLLGGATLATPSATPQDDVFLTRMVTYGSSGFNFNTRMEMHADGNVAAGDWSTSIRFFTNNSSGAAQEVMRLNPNGIVEAQEVIVQPVNGWSDFVFSPGYRLAPLSEVAQMIASEKHLPGIPSAADVAKHGIKTGEMEAKLLAKVEELTLHLIEQEKRISRLEAENEQYRHTASIQ